MPETYEHTSYRIQYEALDWLRGKYPDADISEIPRFPGDILSARERQFCAKNCPGLSRCSTRGYVPIVSREAFGRATRFVVRYAPCSSAQYEREQTGLKNTAEECGIPERYRECTFENFSTLNCEDRVRVAKTLAMDCAEAGLSLLLMGPPGTGKTHLAAAMANYYLAHGKSAVFVPVIKMLDEIKAGFNSSGAIQVESAIRAADFVAIDDIGAQKDSEWVTERLFELIDSRYRENKPVVITTNAEKLEQFAALAGTRGTMMTSRIMDESYSRVASLSKCRDYRSIRKQKKLI